MPDESPQAPEPIQTPQPTEPVERSDAERAVDHATIASSIDELLPALIAKLGATGLAELEIREDALRVRLRRPAEGIALDRRVGDRSIRSERPRGTGSAIAPHVPGLTPVGPGRETPPSLPGETVLVPQDAATIQAAIAIALYEFAEAVEDAD